MISPSGRVEVLAGRLVDEVDTLHECLYDAQFTDADLGVDAALVTLVLAVPRASEARIVRTRLFGLHREIEVPLYEYLVSLNGIVDPRVTDESETFDHVLYSVSADASRVHVTFAASPSWSLRVTADSTSRVSVLGSRSPTGTTRKVLLGPVQILGGGPSR